MAIITARIFHSLEGDLDGWYLITPAKSQWWYKTVARWTCIFQEIQKWAFWKIYMERKFSQWTARKLSNNWSKMTLIQSKLNLYHQLNKKEFLSKLNLNVPEDKKKLYEQLILQNHHVFSKTKDHLGKPNNFKQKIFIKMDEPIFQKVISNFGQQF